MCMPNQNVSSSSLSTKNLVCIICSSHACSCAQTRTLVLKSSCKGKTVYNAHADTSKAMIDFDDCKHINYFAFQHIHTQQIINWLICNMLDRTFYGRLILIYSSYMLVT